MSNVNLSNFKVGTAHYSHVINTETDATHVLNSEGAVVYTVDSNAKAFKGNEVIGQFNLVYLKGENFAPVWEYTSIDKKHIFNHGLNDLLNTELLVFKALIEAYTIAKLAEVEQL
jgi:hypothetical protein